jgi:DNA-binding NarL/FixJ family response regulator
MLKVVLVDDHLIFRESLRKLLESEKRASVIAETSNGKLFLEVLEENAPDLVLMDISMPVMDGIEASQLALKKYPTLKILILSSYGDEKHYFKLMEAGVKGFVLKSSGILELSRAMDEIMAGGSWFSRELLQKVIINISKPTQKEAGISERELEVLKYICEGHTNDEIAEKLHLSSETIKWHRNNLLSKTCCKNTASLVMYSIKNKIINV